METLYTSLSIFIILVAILYFAYLLVYIRNTFRKLPYVPIRKADMKRVIQIADVNEGDILYDLGSGDGRMMIEFAKKGLRCTGFELSAFYVALTNLKAKIRSLKNCRAEKKDMFEVDIRGANIIYLYLNPNFTKMFKERIYKTLKKGTKIITYCFPIEGLTPKKMTDIGGKRKIFLYEV